MKLSKYIEMCDILEDENLSEIDKQIEIISLVYALDVEEIEAMSLSEYNKYSSKLMELTNIKKVNPKDKYIINNREYHPILNAVDINVAQYIDYNNYLKMENRLDKIVGVLSVFMIPKGKEYGEYDIEQVKNDIKDMTVGEVYGLADFFLLYSKELINNTLTSLEKKVKKMKKKMKQK